MAVFDDINSKLECLDSLFNPQLEAPSGFPGQDGSWATNFAPQDPSGFAPQQVSQAPLPTVPKVVAPPAKAGAPELDLKVALKALRSNKALQQKAQELAGISSGDVPKAAPAFPGPEEALREWQKMRMAELQQALDANKAKQMQLQLGEMQAGSSASTAGPPDQTLSGLLGMGGQPAEVMAGGQPAKVVTEGQPAEVMTPDMFAQVMMGGQAAGLPFFAEFMESMMKGQQPEAVVGGQPAGGEEAAALQPGGPGDPMAKLHQTIQAIREKESLPRVSEETEGLPLVQGAYLQNKRKSELEEQIAELDEKRQKLMERQAQIVEEERKKLEAEHIAQQFAEQQMKFQQEFMEQHAQEIIEAQQQQFLEQATLLSWQEQMQEYEAKKAKPNDRPDNYQPRKKALCKHYQQNTCQKGKDCTFVHGEEDLHAGDWICTCGNLNFSRRSMCQICKVPRPAGAGTGGGGRDRGSNRAFIERGQSSVINAQLAAASGHRGMPV